MTIKELIDKYGIEEATGAQAGNVLVRNGRAAQRDNAVPEIKAKKPEILAYFAQQRAAAKQAREEREAKIAAIKGLAELKAAYADLASWRREFNASFESEDGGGFGARPMPKYDIDGMLARYPQAAAYLKAEEEANKTNYELSEIGKRALETVIAGDWEKAMETMEAEKNAFVEKHIWD